MLVVASRDKRNRYKFVAEALNITENVRCRVLKNQGWLLPYFVKSVLHAFKERNKVQLVIVIGAEFSGFLWTALGKWIMKRPLILRLGGDPVQVRKERIRTSLEKGRPLLLLKFLTNYGFTKLALRHADGLIVVNEYLRSRVQPYLQIGVPVAVIPQPIEAKVTPEVDRNAQSSRVTLLTITNFHFREKYEGVQSIVKYLVEGIENGEFEECITLEILGSGEYLQDFARFQKEDIRCPANLKINIRGFVSDTEAFYQRAGIFVYCSKLDALPNVLLEAKRYGLPMLVNKFEPYYEVLENGRHALFFADKDGKEFRMNLRKLMDDKELRLAMGRLNYEDVRKRYSMRSISEKYSTLLRATLAKSQ